LIVFPAAEIGVKGYFCSNLGGTLTCPPGATLRAALAELLEGGEVRTTRDLPETDPGDPVRYRRGLVFYELGPGA